MTASRDHALWYARAMHWPVLPLHSIRDGCCTCGKDCSSPGKHPLISHGLTEATMDPEIIASWWARWPGANIGIATGSGLVVLDVDPAHGGESSLEDLEDQYGRMPHTVMSLTGGGGQHHLFGHPGGVEVRSTAGRLGAGLDVRGDGGYIVAPPSRHVSGHSYEWEASCEPGTAGPGLAKIPPWLLALMSTERGWRARTLDEWSALVSEPAPEGGRNQRLTQLAGLLLRERRPILPASAAKELILAWNATHCIPPLPDKEVMTIINHIAAKEHRRRK